MNVLAADIGGTKSWICLARVATSGELHILFEHIYQSQNYKNASFLLKQFLQDASAEKLSINHMCLALPGITGKQTAKLTNLDWQLDAVQLKQEFLVDQVSFVNDFEAAALGISTLNKHDYITLNKGKFIEKGIKVVTGAGTGLGLSWLNYIHGHYRANSTEGGHIDFAPVNPQQIALLKTLQQSYSHVSYERLLSGDGLQAIYNFLKQTEQHTLTAKEITEQANHGNEIAQNSLKLFAEIYGAYIGNLAVLFKPTGGIYLAGGIASKILAWMQSPAFLHASTHKGRMSGIVKSTPIYLVNNNRLGLQGALSIAIQSTHLNNNMNQI